MSRNLELPQRAGQEREITEPVARVAHVNSCLPRLTARGPVRKELDKLVQRLFLSSSGLRSQVVVFTAIEDTSRCSLICAYVSDALATRAGASICVVDANLHSPSLHHHFKCDNRSGLAELIQDPETRLIDVAKPLFESNLSLLTTGFTDLGSEELLRSASLRWRIAELRQEFAYVLIAAPPVQPYPDALLVSQFADGIVLIVRAHFTRRETVREVTEQVATSGVHVLGVVLDERTFPIPEAIYSRV